MSIFTWEAFQQEPNSAWPCPFEAKPVFDSVRKILFTLNLDDGRSQGGSRRGNMGNSRLAWRNEAPTCWLWSLRAFARKTFLVDDLKEWWRPPAIPYPTNLEEGLPKDLLQSLDTLNASNHANMSPDSNHQLAPKLTIVRLLHDTFCHQSKSNVVVGHS